MDKTGPSDLPAGLLDEIERAKADYNPEVGILLKEYRAGGDGAELTRRLRWLAYQPYVNHWPTIRLAAEDFLGSLFMEFGTCLKRLRTNAILANDVPGYIIGHLQHTVTHYMAENSQHIPPKHSTNSMRKKRGAEPYPGLTRVSNRKRTEGTEKEDERVTHDHLTDATYTEKENIYHRLAAVAESPLEHEIIACLERGARHADIADAVGISMRRLRLIRARLMERVAA